MSSSQTVAGRLWHAALCALPLALPLSSPLASANTPPAIGGTPPATVVAAHYYAFQPYASDPDHDSLSFSISNKPSWASFTPSNGRLYGTPIPPANVGTFGNIVLCVSDGAYRRCLPAFAVKVLPLPDNPPVIKGTPPTTATAGSAYSFQPTAYDPNGLRIDFGIWDKPAWLNFNSTTGRLYGTPTAADVGKYATIVVSVYDGYYEGNLPAFAITVSAAAELPPSAVTISWTPPTENTNGSVLTNLAGYHLYYGTSQANLNHVIAISNPGLARYVVSNLSAARWYFALTSINMGGVESPPSAVASAVVQ